MKYMMTLLALVVAAATVSGQSGATNPLIGAWKVEAAQRLRVAMISMHTSPLAPLGRTHDAGGMNVYIRELARELGRSGVEIDIFTRRIDCDTPTVQYPAHGVRLISLPAGPATLLPPTELVVDGLPFAIRHHHDRRPVIIFHHEPAQEPGPVRRHARAPSVDSVHREHIPTGYQVRCQVDPL